MSEHSVSSIAVTSNYQSIFDVRLNSHSAIVDQLIGNKPLNPDVITTTDLFDDLYRIRHNLVHAIICDVRGLRFGEKTLEDIIITSKTKLKTTLYYDLVKKQTPDYLEINGDKAFMMEVSVSRNDNMIKDKNIQVFSPIIFP